ncbi:helix-turn-helix domain-containing protein [Taklimakanibacter deserti]|uniref:helix-turn-helix domain-containing protein n=1 Tax=Taklimakanibacter deserti TaxID=2267839 RepID=UPI0034D48B96
MRLLHTIEEIGDILRIKRTKTYDLVNEHELTLVKIGKRSLITDESLKAYLAKITDAANAAR